MFIASAAIPAKNTVLVVNADIVTMDPKKPSAEAMAFSGGRIVAIGTESEVRKAIGEYTKFYNYYGDIHYDITLGPERAQRLSAVGEAFRAGIKPTMHNDPPVTPVDPLFNMWIAVKRQAKSGRILGADQATTPKQDLEACTTNAAFQFGKEKDAGSLEVGKFADFVVLDRNPLKVVSDEIRNLRVPATVRGGLITYSAVPEYDRITPPR